MKHTLSTLILTLTLFISPQAWAHPGEEGVKTDEKTTHHGHIKPLDAALLNTVPLGYGSFKQGDQVGGYALMAIDGLSLASLAVGAGWLVNEWVVTQANPQQSRSGYEFAFGYGLAVYGLAGLGLGRAVGYTAPFVYDAFEPHSGSAELPVAAGESAKVRPQINYQLKF